MRKVETSISLPGTAYEDGLAQQGLAPVAGVDEVGRGPLAGPVVTCALILPLGLVIDGVNDSKKLSAKKRTLLAAEIKSVAIDYAFGIVDAETIDRINILQATLLAMKMAVEGLQILPKAALVDGVTSPHLSCKVVCLAKGDAKSHLIAAASILAKVERDAMMADIHDIFPMYGFNSHKGYGTKVHGEALMQYGLCPQHRRSFCRRYL